MTHTPRNLPATDRIGGGGAATSAGIRFEQQLGALFSSWILAGDRFDDSFRLGAAMPEWIRFETEAPVDDLLIKTSDGGYVAVQAKTSASLSEEPNSPLSKTIMQFVRHWFVARQGDGSMGWNRPLDPARDRLVLVVSPQASGQVRDHLPAALRLVAQPGGGALNQTQQQAFQVFSNLVERAWASITMNPFDTNLLRELAKLVAVVTFDGAQGYAVAGGSLIKAFGMDVDAATAFTALSDLSGQLMKDRGGGDLPTLRQLLARRGVVLSAPPEYRTDIEALKRHSKRIAEALSSYETIEVAGGAPLSVRRDCQAAIEAAVRNGPLLIIGEPGAGKSGVLNAVARKLSNDGADILQLAVDRYSIESLEGLTAELGLRHPLLDVLEAWDGLEPAYLIVDALDATRGGRGEGVFRALIERVVERKGRWNVIASIRNFDLRMGQQFRALFKGTPPDVLLADPSFGQIQHIQVPPWTKVEFDQLLQQSPALATCLAKAPPRLRDLAMVPFNTRLLSELISAEAVKHLDEVASQADLLRLYWDHRVEGHGLPAKIALSRVVQLMVQARALRAPTLHAAGDNPAMIDTLCKEGVLVVVDSQRWVQFRHHLLFDYAAARLALDPNAIASDAYKFSKSEALGLMLSPALGFVLREVWESEIDHARFWSILGTLINDEHGDPIIRSTAGRLGAEFPTSAQDCLWLGNRAIAGDKIAPKALSHITGAFVVRLQDEKQFPLEPWAHLADCLATAPATVASTLRFLLHNLIGRINDAGLTQMLGRAARALLAHGLAQPDPGFIVRSAIDFVIATYGTDTEASRALLVQIFDRNRLDRFGHQEVPAVCHKIAAVGDVDPEFVTDIYRVVFDYEVTEDRQTQISQSQILNLTSNARQDYGMARWSLGEYLPKFLQTHPRAAVRAVVTAVEGYVAREHAPSEDTCDIELEVSGRSIRLREDRSYIWAHDPNSRYGRDAESLVSKLRAHLKFATETEALVLIDILINEASFAILWSRMFLCAVERADGLVDKLWAIAVTEPFLVLSDTRKDAIDLVAIGIGRRSAQERQTFERTVLGFDFSRFKHPIEVRRAFLERLFSAIGRDQLVTDEARRIFEEIPQDQTTTNERLFVVRTLAGTPEDFHWLEGLDKEAPENSRVIDAINIAKKLLRLEAQSEDVAVASLEDSLAALQAIRNSLAGNAPHPGLQRSAEAVIGQGCDVIVSKQLLVSKEAPPTPEQDATFIALLDIAGRSESPALGAETEASFEESASWGSPAARVEAAQAYWNLFAQRADLYPELMPRARELLSDSHPAVRLNASMRLVKIWDLDRDQFWRLLADRLTREPNLTIIEHLLGDVISKLIHADQQRSLELLLFLLQRESPGSDRERRLYKAIADKLAVLWVAYQAKEAKLVLDRWSSAPWQHAEEVRRVLSSLRDAIVAGAGEIPDKDADVRQRAQALFSDIVNAANSRLAGKISDADSHAAAEVQECAHLINTAGMEMFFAIDAGSSRRLGNTALCHADLNVFLQENTDLLKRIGKYAHPHTTYYLLQLVERLVEVDAEAAFDLAASLLLGGSRSGYEHESLGVDLLVRLIGVFLADHKEIFEDSTRRAALVDCLEIFLEVGWPEARRLLYRLPELIQ
ncbi:ATP-binding protein [Pigmentiphaga aceris]|uniref:ATP-binding protein n=1 Tax=Pigmentiphaga aceris TaxID=1940612 RepID=A0A5C0AXW4_9BURK|nr:ATP-binding protein [Pigmentiphaga aceris]QEI05670.1 ATP-binding protein [Pigmentiphaga aceris]